MDKDSEISSAEVEKAIDQKRAAAVAKPALAPARGSTLLKISGVARSLAQKLPFLDRENGCRFVQRHG